MRFSWLIAAVLLASCAHTKGEAAKADDAKAADAYYPLAVGTGWKYQVQLLGEKRTIDVAIIKQEGGFFTDSMGAKLSADAYGVRDEKRYLLRNPIREGTTWTNVVSVSSVEHYKIVSAGAACEAPAGRWNDCVTVESRNRVATDKELVNEMTFAPNVGIVRLSTVLEDKGKRIPQSTLALLAFTPAAPAPAAPKAP